MTRYQALATDEVSISSGTAGPRKLMRRILTCSVLLSIVSFFVVMAYYPTVFKGSPMIFDSSFQMPSLASFGQKAAIFFKFRTDSTNISTVSDSPLPTRMTLKPLVFNFHESSCQKYFELANCSASLEAKGKQHEWPRLQDASEYLDFRRVLLVLHYNTIAYGSAAKIYSVYHRLFAKIVFCGPDHSEAAFTPFFTNDSKAMLSPNETSFVFFGSYIGTHTMAPYLCLPLALDKHPGDYAGAMVMSDDVMLNYWNLKALNKTLDKNWAMADPINNMPFDIDTSHFCIKNSTNNTEDCRPGVGNWMWPGHNRKEIRRFYDALSELADGNMSVLTQWNMSDPHKFGANRSVNEWIEYWKQAKANLTRATGGERRLIGLANGDLFYVAGRYLSTAAPFFRLLGRHRIFLEIGVVTGVSAISSLEDFQTIDSTAEDWGNGVIRGKPFIDSYKMSYEMVHPFKLRSLDDYFKYRNLSFLPDVIKKSHLTSITTACVYCNLVKLGIAFARFQRGEHPTVD